MKSRIILPFILLILLFLISSCSDQDGNQNKADEKGDYSTVSNLIADRNRARKDIKKSPPSRKTIPAKSLPEKKISSQESRTDEMSPVILYEQKIKIVGSESGRTIATGVAHINKKGQIVRITISKKN